MHVSSKQKREQEIARRRDGSRHASVSSDVKKKTKKTGVHMDVASTDITRFHVT